MKLIIPCMSILFFMCAQVNCSEGLPTSGSSQEIPSIRMPHVPIDLARGLYAFAANEDLELLALIDKVGGVDPDTLLSVEYTVEGETESVIFMETPFQRAIQLDKLIAVQAMIQRKACLAPAGGPTALERAVNAGATRVADFLRSMMEQA